MNIIENENTSHIKLSLLENSHRFLVEAVDNVIRAEKDPNQLQFAILHLVQCLELTLKEILRSKHELFIFADIDNPRNTVSISKALERIQNKKIVGVEVTKREIKKIQEAIKIRNKITHYEFNLNHNYGLSKFYEIFSFVVYLQKRYIDTDIINIIEPENLYNLINIKKCFTELLKKTNQLIEDYDIENEFIWECPNCGVDTFVIQDGKDTCFLCSWEEMVIECTHCNDLVFSTEIKDISYLFDYDLCEGINQLMNNYGYSTSNTEVCKKCYAKIEKNISEQRIERDSQFEEDYSRDC